MLYIKRKKRGDVYLFIESDYISEITAVFTAANARVRLYQMLDWLHPSQVYIAVIQILWYSYTMKQILNTNKSPEKHKATPFEFGGGLGQWEVDGKDYIEELVISGEKSYSYRTRYGMVAQRKVKFK